MSVAYDLSPAKSRYGLGAASDSYRISELACAPRAPSEGLYSEVGLALVLDGAFEYRGRHGSALALPGAIILANRDEHFSCAQSDTPSNRRLALFFGDAMIAGIADACGLDAPAFSRATLPPSREAAAIAALLRRAARGDENDAMAVAAAAFEAATPARTHAPAPADKRRVLDAVRYIQANFAGNCALATLAGVAGISQFHFARLFKLVTGQSPAQFVLHIRLAAAARRLLESAAPVAQIAYETGFNDLSHFNASFKSAFGATPTAWRRANSAPR